MNGLKQKFIINVSIAVLLEAVFLYVGAEYLVKDVEKYSSKIVSDEQAIYVQDAKNAQLSDVKRIYEEATAKMDTVSASVVDKENTVIFIEEAEKAAVRNKVKLSIKNQDSSKKEEAASDLLTTSEFNFRVGGTFNNVMHFLGEIENFKYCLRIENAEMVYDDYDKYNKDMIVLTFNVKLYQKSSQK
jgi:hypothetical protein